MLKQYNNKKTNHPSWCKNATIYELNLRQFTQEGTLQAAEYHLTRLKDLGINIIWLMPIHEIGLEKRKGPLGSPYSVRDYYSVNHEFGTKKDLKHFVEHAHRLGLYVILDWVANHTSWDNDLVTERPDWYAKDWKGDFLSTPWRNWTDTIDLDYQHAGLRKYMTEAMKYWVTKVDIDGFRCDVADYVPLDFWINTRKELETIKPVFMLAESDSRDLHKRAFDMTYAWAWYDALNQIATANAHLCGLFSYYSLNEKIYPRDAIRMLFVSNHDKNAWVGTQFEQFGEGLIPAIALSVISEGMPLIYNGQEAGNTKRLLFFDKDPIEWKEHPIADLYKKLFALKRENTALWNAKWGARMIKISNTVPKKVLSFIRQDKRHKVFAVFNFSEERQLVKFYDSIWHGRYTDYFAKESIQLGHRTQLALEPWDYKIFII